MDFQVWGRQSPQVLNSIGRFDNPLAINSRLSYSHFLMPGCVHIVDMWPLTM